MVFGKGRLQRAVEATLRVLLWIAFLIGVMTLVGFASHRFHSSIMPRAHAHDWYPMECCSMMDCATVEEVAYLPGEALLPTMVVRTRHGVAVIPPTLPRRESKDNKMHACMRPARDIHGELIPGKMQAICVFMPGGS